MEGFITLAIVQFLLTVVFFIYTKESIYSGIHQFGSSNPVLSVFFLLWLIAISISWLGLFWDEQSWHWLAGTIRHWYILLEVSFGITLIYFLKQNQLSLKAIYLSLAVGMLIVGAIQLYLLLSAASPDSHLWFFNPPFAGHIRDIGNVACVAAVFFCVMVLKTAKWQMKLVYLFCLLFCLSYIIWTGGRMALIATILTFFLLFIVHWQKESIAAIVLVFLLAFPLSQQVSLFDWNGFHRHLTPIEKPITTELSNLNQISTGRSEMWALSLQAMSASPWFGLGPYGYFFIENRSYGDQPHNFLIQFLVEWGVIGTLLLLFALILVVKKQLILFRLPQESISIDQLLAPSVVVVLSIHGLTGGTYFNYQPVICLTPALAACFLNLHESPPDRSVQENTTLAR